MYSTLKFKRLRHQVRAKVQNKIVLNAKMDLSNMSFVSTTHECIDTELHWEASGKHNSIE